MDATRGQLVFWWGSFVVPSELTTPLPYLLPIAVLAAVGGYGVWRRSRRFLPRAAVVAAAALVVHVLLVVTLPG